MNDVTLSVIVPVYNTGAYLRECVRSILTQSFSDFELIIIDDGSTDGSSVLCDALGGEDSRICVFHQQNQGLSAVRNKGIDLAHGEYILFIDSDDYIEPQMFAEMLDAAHRHDADVVMCRYNKMDSHHKVLSVKGFGSETVLSGLEATSMIMRDRQIQSHMWNKLIRRELFQGVRFPLNRNFEDLAATYKLIDKANYVVAIPYPGYNYIAHPEAITQATKYTARWVRNQCDVIEAWKERFIYVKTHDRLVALAPFCAGKTYDKCIHFIDRCLRYHVSLPQDLKQKVDECMVMLEDGNLKGIPWRFRWEIMVARCRICASHVLRMLRCRQ